MGGKLLPDLAWNNVLSLHLFISLLPPGKTLSEPLNFRDLFGFHVAARRGLQLALEAVFPPCPPLGEFPRPCGSGFCALLPMGKGLGFWEQRGVPQPIHTEAIQFNVVFIGKVEARAVGKGRLGRERGCLGSLALPPPGHGG